MQWHVDALFLISLRLGNLNTELICQCVHGNKNSMLISQVSGSKSFVRQAQRCFDLAPGVTIVKKQFIHSPIFINECINDLLTN